MKIVTMNYVKTFNGSKVLIRRAKTKSPGAKCKLNKSCDLLMLKCDKYFICSTINSIIVAYKFVLLSLKTYIDIVSSP